MNEPINGTQLDGPQLEEALKHDAARKPSPCVFRTAEVLEAIHAPCEVCHVREGVWCVGAVCAPLPNGEMVADFAHAERLALACHEVSRAVHRKIADLRAGLPMGDELKAATHKWAGALEYANAVVRQAMADTLQRVARELNVEPQWLVQLSVKLGATPPVASPESPQPTSGPAVGRPSLEDRIDRVEQEVALMRAMVMARK